MFKWKIGDAVKVIDNLSFFFGKDGIVDHYNEELFYNVYVRFPDNTKCNFRIKELEYYNETSHQA